MRSCLLVLLLCLLAACGGKKSSQERVQWGEMRELFPPTLEQAPAGAAAAPTAPAAGTTAAAGASAAAAGDVMIGSGPALAAEFEEAPSAPQRQASGEPEASLKPPPSALAQGAPPPSIEAVPPATPSEASARAEPAAATPPKASSAAAASPAAAQAEPAAATPPKTPSAVAASRPEPAPPAPPAPAPPSPPSAAVPTPAPAATTAAAASAASARVEPTAAPDEPGWPRALTSSGVVFKIHEPQPDAWNDDTMLAHAMVSAQPDARAQAATGALRLTARTDVDEAAGVVRLSNVQITGVRFPDAADKTLAAWLAALRTGAPELLDTVSIARVQSGMAQVRARERGAAVLQVPVPRVVLVKKPTVLVYIDGDPQFVSVKGTALSGVLNTRTVLLKDARGKLYLRVYDGWVGADSLRGPWAVVKPPPEAAKLEQTARATGRANLLRGKPDPKSGRYPSLGKGLPQIIVATKPTAVLVLDGEPRFAPIPGTSLQYATNTSAHVFRDVDAKQIYVRVAGYWFRSSSTAGPWEHVPLASLPAGFLAIPDGSPKAAVKNTIAAAQTDTPAPDSGSAPVMVAADPTRTRLNLTLAGDPKLEPIPGTQLNYVANASVPVIQFDDERWFAIQNGVWFTATSVTGPWTVTSQVPPEIYAIPPTVPIYSAIHSRVYSSSSDTVYYGYENPQSLGGASGGAVGVEDQGQDYLYTPPAGMYWGWYY
jgi:hypothetical protein